jgi:hypothetical protein
MNGRVSRVDGRNKFPLWISAALAHHPRPSLEDAADRYAIKTFTTRPEPEVNLAE